MTPQPNPVPPPAPKAVKTIEQKEAEISHALVVIQTCAKILAIRFFLFLSLAGAFTLSLIATDTQSMMSSVDLVLYASVTILPLTVLEFRGRSGG